jgi:hypothetical protein
MAQEGTLVLTEGKMPVVFVFTPKCFVTPFTSHDVCPAFLVATSGCPIHRDVISHLSKLKILTLRVLRRSQLAVL